MLLGVTDWVKIKEQNKGGADFDLEIGPLNVCLCSISMAIKSDIRKMKSVDQNDKRDIKSIGNKKKLQEF